MSNADYEKFKDACAQLPFLQDERKEAAEAHISAYLASPTNFEGLRAVLENEQNSQVKLVAVETLNKAIMGMAREEPDILALCRDAADAYASDSLTAEEALNAYYYNVVKYLMGFLKAAHASNPKFITNSIANVVATYVEVQVFNFNALEPVAQLISTEFFGQNAGPAELHLGLKLFYFCVNNIVIAAVNYNFFKYRKMLTAFQNGLLYDAFNSTRAAIKVICGSLTGNGADSGTLELLALALEVYFKCLTFPFSLSFFDFKEDINLEEITILLYPEAYASGLIDFEFYDLLYKLLELKLSKDVSLTITRILSRCAASRTSIMPDDPTKFAFKQKSVEGFIQMTFHCPLDDEAFASEIIECALRIIFVSGALSMISHPLVRESFDKAATMLSTAVVQLCGKLDSKLMQQLIEFWKKLKPFKESFNSTQKISDFLSFYFEHNFTQRKTGGFYSDGLKSYKRLKEQVELAYDNLKDLMSVSMVTSCKVVLASSEALVAQFALVQAKQLGEELYANRLGHFLLVFTQTFLKTDSFSSYHSSHASGAEDEYFGTAARVCSQLFELIANFRSYTRAVDTSAMRGFVLSTLYYYETFTTLVISSQSYSAELDALVVEDELYRRLSEQYKMCASFEDFFDSVTSTVIENLQYGSFCVTKASLHVVRVCTDKLKRVFHGRKKDKSVFSNLCAKLVSAGNAQLIAPKQLKLRVYLYEIVGMCYLDEKYSEYIDNCHAILKQIMGDANGGEVELKRVFYDLYGVYKSISYTKVISVFTKICYPRVQDLLTRYGAANLGDSAFVVLLIDFYAHLFERTAQNYQVTQSQTVTFKIITDACRMISMLLAELNGALSRLTTPEAILEFMTANIKLVKKFLTAFESLLKNTDISFSVFHYFGSEEFLNFSRNIFKFLCLVCDCLLRHFPDKQALFYGVLKEGLKCLSDYIVEYFTVEEIGDLLRLVADIFDRRASAIISEAQLKVHIDDTVIDDIHAMVRSLLVSLYEEYKIYVDNYAYQQKIKSVIAAYGPMSLDFCLRIVELSQMAGSVIRQGIALSDIVFYFVVVFQEASVFDGILQRTLTEERSAQMTQEVRTALAEITSNLRFSLDESNREDFNRNFNVYVKHLNERTKARGLSGHAYNVD